MLKGFLNSGFLNFPVVSHAVRNIKAVIIASTAETHKDLAVAALLNDKDVLIEKPFCLSLLDAKIISKLAVEKKKILMVGHLLNYHNAFVKIINFVLSSPFF